MGLLGHRDLPLLQYVGHYCTELTRGSAARPATLSRVLVAAASMWPANERGTGWVPWLYKRQLAYCLICTPTIRRGGGARPVDFRRGGHPLHSAIPSGTRDRPGALRSGNNSNLVAAPLYTDLGA